MLETPVTRSLRLHAPCLLLPQQRKPINWIYFTLPEAISSRFPLKLTQPFSRKVPPLLQVPTSRTKCPGPSRLGLLGCEGVRPSYAQACSKQALGQNTHSPPRTCTNQSTPPVETTLGPISSGLIHYTSRYFHYFHTPPLARILPGPQMLSESS